MSWQMADASSSRRARMNWGVPEHLKTKGAAFSLMPKILDPDALLRHTDTAIANAEYTQATRHLSLLFPSTPTPTSAASSSVDESKISQMSLPSGSSITAHVQPMPPDKMTPRPKPRSASRFSPSVRDYPANCQTRPKPVSRMRPNLDVGGVDSNVGNSNGLLMRKDINTGLAESELAATAHRLLDGTLSTESQGATNSAEFAAGRSYASEGQPSASWSLEAEENVSKVDRSGDYDPQAADEAYRAGYSALSEGHTEQALSFLRVASSRCPPDKHIALAKIQRLKAAISDILQKQSSPPTDRDVNS